MRLFATYMPTASVFRFWDILLPMAGTENAEPNHRIYLVDLAFGLLKVRKDDLMQCNSAREIRSCVLYAFGAMYDASSAVDITLHTHRFLWQIGGGFSVGKIHQLCNQRREDFRMVNQTTIEQNDLLKELTHGASLGTIKRTGYMSPSGQKGVNVTEIARQVMPVLKTAVETIRGRVPEPGRLSEADSQRAPPVHWAMHRPMPMVAHMMSETFLTKTWDIIKSSLMMGDVDTIPSLRGPPPSIHPDVASVFSEALEAPGLNQANLLAALQMDVPNWTRYSGRLWEAFTNRRDCVLKRRLGEEEEEKRGLHNLFGLLPSNGQEHRLRKMIEQNPLDRAPESVSMNEIFTSLICCSKGTLGYKASALFDVYGHTQQGVKDKKHMIPPTNFAKSLTRADAAKTKVVAAPEPKDEKNHALHFTVWSNYPRKHTLVGSVFIPKLTEFESADTKTMGDVKTYNIWGPPPAEMQPQDKLTTPLSISEHQDKSNPDLPVLPSPGNDGDNNQPGGGSDNKSASSAASSRPGSGKKPGALHSFFFGNSKQQAAEQDEEKDFASHFAVKDKVCLGDMRLAINWLPKATTTSAEGQLCVELKGITFYEMYTNEPYKKNPYVTLHTYKKEKEVPIKRWDPRGVFSSDEHKSWLTTHGCFGGDLLWETSMKEGAIGKQNFKHYNRDGKSQGWVPDTKKGGVAGEWTWNEVWGKQYSVQDVQFDEQFVKKEAKRNVMDMLGVRRIVQCILTRSCLNLSNRQMILISDTLFNRSGAVPGLLEAWLVRGQDPKPIAHKDRYVDVNAEPKAMNLRQLKEKWGNDAVDVTNQLALEHERQVAFSGHLNLFNKTYRDSFKQDNSRGLHLKDMGIKDPFGFTTTKTLWVRYVRAGDGERCTQGACFSMMGELENDPDPEIYMDLPESCMESMVTREEFISCLIASPILGETLRRMGSIDHVMQPKRPIALDITIMDPHESMGDDLFQDAISVQQSILLEVRDSDLVTQDFLGECWIPPLETLSSIKKDFVLKLQVADYSGEAERGASRETRKKTIVQGKGDNKITGELYVQLQWIYPLFNLNDDGELVKRVEDDEEGGDEDEPEDKTSAKARAEVQAGLHTGQLTITIVRAGGLRRADSMRGRDCDPYVTAWIRNDAREDEENPGQKDPTWKDKPILKTTTVKNNRNPHWKGKHGHGESFKIEVMSGAFEARFEEEADGIIDTIKDSLRSSKTKRRDEEEEEMQALSKFGDKGLKLKFGKEAKAVVATNAPQDQAARVEAAKKAAEEAKKEPELGCNHEVEVFRGDSIREFKAKVTLACQREQKFWDKKGISFDSNARKYADITIAFKHLVMIFVPSAKVKSLFAQKLQGGEEYRHAYQMALMDPSSWQPLEPTRTFHQYPQYHFDAEGGTPQQLRILEAAESYKNVNLRYKEFDAEQNKKRFEDQDSDRSCFGWAKYYHHGDLKPDSKDPETGEKFEDGATTTKSGKPRPEEDQVLPWEWRPAIIHPSEKKQHYTVDWCFKCFEANSSEGPPKPKRAAEEHKSDTVMLTPRVPQMAEAFDPAHEAVLEQARTLRSLGKTDWEIEAELNTLLKNSWEAEKKKAKDGEKSKIPRPIPITVDIIKGYLYRAEILEAQKQSAASGLKTGAK